MDDSRGRAQVTLGGATPVLVVLGSIRKKDEQGTRSKPVISTLPQSLPQLLPPGCHPVPVPSLAYFSEL